MMLCLLLFYLRTRLEMSRPGMSRLGFQLPRLMLMTHLPEIDAKHRHKKTGTGF